MQIVRPPAGGQAFFIGGIVIPEARLDAFRLEWRAVTKDFELVESGKRPRRPNDIKAVDFIRHYHTDELDDSRREAPGLAKIARFAEKFDILPLVLAIPKAEAGDGLLGTTKKGGSTIQLSETLPFLIGTFGAFLQQKSAYGSVRMDRLKNTTEEAEFQGCWDVHVRGVRKVSKELDFVDSEGCPEVQLADVLLGLLRGVFERDGEIPPIFGDLMRRAQAASLWFVQLT